MKRIIWIVAALVVVGGLFAIGSRPSPENVAVGHHAVSNVKSICTEDDVWVAEFSLEVDADRPNLTWSVDDIELGAATVENSFVLEVTVANDVASHSETFTARWSNGNSDGPFTLTAIRPSLCTTPGTTSTVATTVPDRDVPTTTVVPPKSCDGPAPCDRMPPPGKPCTPQTPCDSVPTTTPATTIPPVTTERPQPPPTTAPIATTTTVERKLPKTS